MHEQPRRYAGSASTKIPIHPAQQLSPDPSPDNLSSDQIQEAPMVPTPEPPVAKPNKQPPADAVIPTMGWPKFHYQFNCLFGQAHKVPAVNRKQRRQMEQAERAAAKHQQEQNLEDRKAFLIDYLRWLAAQPGLQPVINVGNIKGSASKTTTSLYLASVIAYYTYKFALVLPTTANTATSTVALMAGIPQDATIAVSELSREIKQYGSFRAVSNRVPRTKYGMGVVSEDPDDNVNVSNDYGARQFGEMVDTILPSLDVLILDNGNDNVVVDTIPVEAVRRCTVMVLTATASLAPTMAKVLSTMTAYRSDTIAPEDAPESFIATPEKVKHAIVAVSNVPPDKEVNYANLLRLNTVPFTGPTLSIPYDEYIASDDGSVSVCDIMAIAPATLVAYLELAVACYEQTAKLLGYDLSEFESVRTRPSIPSMSVLDPKPPALGDTL